MQKDTNRETSELDWNTIETLSDMKEVCQRVAIVTDSAHAELDK